MTSDPIGEDIPRLSSKTSLTPSDSHKVVIEVTESDVETKGILLHLLFTSLIRATKCENMYNRYVYRQVFGQTTIDNRIFAWNVAHRIAIWLATAIL